MIPTSTIWQLRTVLMLGWQNREYSMPNTFYELSSSNRYGGSTVSGIVYLHDISQVRMPNTTLRDLAMFRKWCGSDAVHNVVFTTTKWGDVAPGLGWRREEQITANHWKRIFDEGANITRFTDTGTVSNAWDVVNLIIR